MKAAFHLIPILLIILLIGHNAYPISIAEQSSKDYYYTTKILREIKPMIANFRTDENKKEIDTIKKTMRMPAFSTTGIILIYQLKNIIILNLK